MNGNPNGGTNTSNGFVAFFRAGLIEAWGRGTLMILAECQKAGLPQPVFTDDASGFCIEFEAAGVQLPVKSSEESSEESSGEGSVKLIALLQANPAITLREVAEKLGISSRAVEKQAAKLKKEGKLRRVGPNKGGYWKVFGER